MSATALSFLLYGVAFIAFASFFIRARALGRDPTPAGQQGDTARRRELNFQLLIGVVALVAAYVL